MLIRNAEVWGYGRADVRIADGVIAEIAIPSSSRADVPYAGRIVDAGGGALLPGLHDHHIHLAGLAARAQSAWCGPPEVETREALAARLAAHPGSGWLRAIGYHESVMGLPDAGALDRLVPNRPLRMQHRSGRMWLLNSPALAALLACAEPPPGLERDGNGFTGRLFDEDQWLQRALASAPPDFSAVSSQLAAWGVTGFTDMSPRNDPLMAAHFAAQRRSGSLRQSPWLAGSLALARACPEGWHLGPAKLHLHEAALPPFDEVSAFIAAAHDQQRTAAIHCVTEVELVFALAALECAGVRDGDRIEHASIASPDLVARIAAHGLAVCVQPHFVAERGDAYRRDVEPRHQGDLYRLASLAEAGITLAGGSDAPFGGADPWAAIRAAVLRQTDGGLSFGPQEALSPEVALALFLADPANLARQRRIEMGGAADLVLLDRPWQDARDRLSSADVALTLIGGEIAFDSIKQAPVQRDAGRDALS